MRTVSLNIEIEPANGLPARAKKSRLAKQADEREKKGACSQAGYRKKVALVVSIISL